MSDNHRRNRFVFIILVMTSLLLLTMQARGTQNIYIDEVQTTTFGVISSMQAGVGRVIMPVRDLWLTTRELGTLKQSNNRLKNQNRKLEDEARKVSELEKENARLRGLIGLKESRELEAVPARVVARAFNEWQSAVIIDKGSADGVAENMAVIESAGVVGKTISVTKHAAKVLVITDHRCAIGVKVAQSDEFGVIEGAEGDAVPLRYLDKAAKVKKSDTVITSGLGGVFPSGLMIGEIEHVSMPRLSVEKRALIRPAVDFSKLNEVMVIINSPPLPPTFHEES